LLNVETSADNWIIFTYAKTIYEKRPYFLENLLIRAILGANIAELRKANNAENHVNCCAFCNFSWFGWPGTRSG
jgi:hypothetical protein